MIHDLSSTEKTLSLYNQKIFVPKILISIIDNKTILFFEFIWKQFRKLDIMSDNLMNKEDFITKLHGEILYKGENNKKIKKIFIFLIKL